MSDSFFRRVLSPVVTFREGEATTSVLMFVYSFLVMTAYNSIKPSAASKFIEEQPRSSATDDSEGMRASVLESANASAGDCLGAEETLAGSDWSWRGRATSPGTALRIDREALFELLADHMDLLQGIFGAIFGVQRTDSSPS